VNSGQVHVSDFVRAVSKHWVAVMSGGVVVVVLQLIERVFGKNVPIWLYGAVVLLLVLYAAYLVWRDERTSLLSANVLWNRERSTLVTSIQALSQAVPKIEIEIAEAILQPITHNSLRCFLRVTLRNRTEEAPCMIHDCNMAVRIEDKWYSGSTLISANGFQLITCDQLADPDEVPVGQSFHYEDHLPVIEIAREDIVDLRSIVGEEHPLRRGFPQTGWIGFLLKNLPSWPTILEETGGAELEFDQETGEERWVENTVLVRQTDSVQEISLEVIDGHGEHHTSNKLRPFGAWARRITQR
jgi:hypothetical protein